MKKSYWVLFTCTTVFVIACGKFHDLKNDNPTENASYLYGRLFLLDTLTQNARYTPLGGKTVTVSYSDVTDTLNFLYSTVTDAEGYFKFTTLNAKRNYILRYKEVTSGKLVNARSKSIALPRDTARLIAGVALSGQNGFVITIKDSQGIPVGGADVCVSNSAVPYNNNSCEGSSFSTKSDVNGHVSQFGITGGTYYVVTKQTISNLVYSNKAIFVVGDTTVARPTIAISTPPQKNSLSVTLLDQNNNPVNGGKICLFTSRILFARDTCEGSTYSLISDPSGKAFIRDINPGKYYMLGELSLTKFKLLAKDSITVSTTPLTALLHLK